MEEEVEEKIRKEVRKNYSSIVVTLVGLFIFCLIFTFIITFLIFTLDMELDYVMITVIVIIPIIIVIIYLVAKETGKPYVPIDVFLKRREEVLYSTLGSRQEGNRVGSGFCYLTTKQFIYLPTNSARTRKGINALFLPLKNIQSISRSSQSGFNDIITRDKKYLLSFQNIDEWKDQLKKFLYIRISKL